MHNDGGWNGRVGVLGLLMTFKMVENEDGKKGWGKKVGERIGKDDERWNDL